jgi:hypothetical protein
MEENSSNWILELEEALLDEVFFYHFNVFTSRKFFDAIHCFSDLDVIQLFVATCG